jgi:hypothetical protein
MREYLMLESRMATAGDAIRWLEKEADERGPSEVRLGESNDSLRRFLLARRAR